MLTVVLFIAVLGILVFVHELGHFIMAKRAGMAVEEFGFGFPPRLFGIKKGETTYSINWIPLGGFVKIIGEDGEAAADPQSFAGKTFWQRFSVLIAGVTMNVVLAWLLISIAMAIGLPTVVYEDEQLPKSATLRDVKVAILDVAPESPAAMAGVKPGDTVRQINGQTITTLDQMQDITRDRAGLPTQYVFSRGSETLEKEITPRANPPEGQGFLGVVLGNLGRVSYPWYEAIPRGFVTTWNLGINTLSAFGEIIGKFVSGQKVPGGLAGPVGIAVLTRDVAQLGFVYLLQFTAVLSVNLAIINAVPFPALDGGRILFLVIEKIRGAKLPEKAERVANAAGFALLLLLMLFITVKDVGRFDLFEKLKNLF